LSARYNNIFTGRKWNYKTGITAASGRGCNISKKLFCTIQNNIVIRVFM